MDDENELIGKARAGSTEAFCQLVRVHQARVRAYVARYVRSKDVVDDIAQDVFLAGHQSLVRFRGESSFRIWLLGIARRRVVDHLRAQGTRRQRENGDPDVWAQLEAWQAALLEADDGTRLPRHDDELAALEACMKQLSRENADVVDAHYFKATTLAEIARRLGRKESTVRVSLLRLRQALRACIERRITVPGGEPEGREGGPRG